MRGSYNGNTLAFQARAAGSIPVPRSKSSVVILNRIKRPCGSVVEHSLGKGEVAGPIPAMGTMCGAWQVVRYCVLVMHLNLT
ncbi:MAG: hypothetical protein RIR20_760 [Pseudomonadota bacterium]